MALGPSTPDGQDGGIAVSTTPPASGGPGLVESGAFNDVRAQCASGVVYAGRAHRIPEGAQPDWIHHNGPLRSRTVGRASRGSAPDRGTGLPHETCGSHRPRSTDPDEVVVVGAGGDISPRRTGRDVDGAERYPALAKHFGSSLNDIELPPPAAAAEASSVWRSRQRNALLGSGAGH